MYAVTNTRTRVDEVNGIRKNVFLATEFIGCFETLEEAQEAVKKFVEARKDFSDVSVTTYKEETFVLEERRNKEYVDNLNIHVTN